LQAATTYRLQKPNVLFKNYLLEYLKFYLFQDKRLSNASGIVWLLLYFTILGTFSVIDHFKLKLFIFFFRLKTKSNVLFMYWVNMLFKNYL